MKFTYLFAALVAVGLAACGKTETPPPPKVDGKPAAEAPKPAAAPTAAPATGAPAATDMAKPAAGATTPGMSQPADAGKQLVPAKK